MEDIFVIDLWGAFQFGEDVIGTGPVITDEKFAKGLKAFGCLEVEGDRKFSIHIEAGNKESAKDFSLPP